MNIRYFSGNFFRSRMIATVCGVNVRVFVRRAEGMHRRRRAWPSWAICGDLRRAAGVSLGCVAVAAFLGLPGPSWAVLGDLCGPWLRWVA